MLLHRDSIEFPSPHLALDDGLLAWGGDLSPERLLLAYKSGIFPWFNEGDPICWWSPDPRMVLFPKELYVSKNTQKALDKNLYSFTKNKDFAQVIHHCKSVPRKDQDGTWITSEMEQAYLLLHDKNIAVSYEIWENNTLIGGLYGIDLGTVFCGESMFSLQSGASRLAFTHFVKSHPQYQLIDCQIYNDYLSTFGAKEISRSSFLGLLSQLLA